MRKELIDLLKDLTPRDILDMHPHKNKKGDNLWEKIKNNLTNWITSSIMKIRDKVLKDSIKRYRRK